MATKWVCVFEDHDPKECLLHMFIEQLKAIFLNVPEEYKETTMISVSAYLDEQICLSIGYSRPETKEEMEERESKASREQEAWKKLNIEGAKAMLRQYGYKI